MGNRSCARCGSVKWFWRETGTDGYCNLCSNEDGSLKPEFQWVKDLTAKPSEAFAARSGQTIRQRLLHALRRMYGR